MGFAIFIIACFVSRFVLMGYRGQSAWSFAYKLESWILHQHQERLRLGGRKGTQAEMLIQHRSIPRTARKGLPSLITPTICYSFRETDRTSPSFFGQRMAFAQDLLCRSGYFSGMFSGAWKEANESVIEMTAPEGITPEALHTALGSLYKTMLRFPGKMSWMF